MLKRITHFLLISGFLISLFAIVHAGEMQVVKGKVVTVNGEAPKLAHLHLTELFGSYTKPIKTIEVENNGQFEIVVETPGMYSIYITAVDHEMIQIPLFLDETRKNLTLSVTPNPTPFEKEPAEVQVIGSWNEFNRDEAATMQKQPDGNYLLEMAVEDEQVKYQMFGITLNNRTVNGTTADAFEYDGGGDYYSVVNAEDGKVRIVFDPDEIIETDEAITNVSFNDKASDLQLHYKILSRCDEMVTGYNLAKKSYVKKHGSEKGFEFNGDEIKQFLSGKFNHKDSITRQYAASLYASLYYFTGELNDDEIAKLTSTLTPEAIFWTNAIRPVLLSMADSEPADAQRLLSSIYEKNSKRKIKARALAGMVFLAALQGQTTKTKSLFGKLNENFSDLDEVARYEVMYGEESNVSIGKAVPQFNLTSADGEKISNETISGKYVLVDFWATWCAPCREEMPYLHDAYQKYRNQNFTILSLSMDSDQEAVKRYRENSWEMPWKHSFVPGLWQGQLTADFHVNKTGIPSPFLISPEGQILASHEMLRGEFLEITLSRFLGSN